MPRRRRPSKSVTGPPKCQKLTGSKFGLNLRCARRRLPHSLCLYPNKSTSIVRLFALDRARRTQPLHAPSSSALGSRSGGPGRRARRRRADPVTDRFFACRARPRRRPTFSFLALCAPRDGAHVHARNGEIGPGGGAARRSTPTASFEARHFPISRDPSS